MAIDPNPPSRTLPISTVGMYARGCRVEIIGAGLRLVTRADDDYPGVTLPVAAADSDLSHYLRVEVNLTNVGTDEAMFCCRVDNPGADGLNHCVTGSLALRPGEHGTLQVPLPRGSSARLRRRNCFLACADIRPNLEMK